MVFDLVIKATVPEVSQRVSGNIPAGQDLATHEVQLTIAIQGRHTFVVGGEHGARVQAKQCLMDQDKQEGLPDAERVEDEAKIYSNVKHHERRFDQSMFRFGSQEILPAGELRPNPFQAEHRAEIKTLVSDESSH